MTTVSDSTKIASFARQLRPEQFANLQQPVLVEIGPQPLAFDPRQQFEDVGNNPCSSATTRNDVATILA